jgi:adenosylmethionine---8-amino-7-oxononanoate aminotransferase
MESGAQIAGAVNIYPHNYQRRIAELCNKYDVLLILDEIASGFGRLGNMVEYIAQGSIPDMVCFGKSLTAGYSPLAVTLCNREIFSRFLGEYSDKKQLYHGHTYTGHPIGCSAALANIKLYVKDHLIERIRSNSIYIKKRLREFDNSYSISDRIRHKGLLGAIDLVNNKKDRKPINVIKKNNMRINYFIDRESLHMGVYLRSLGNTIIIVPPLAIDRKNLRLLLDVISQLINKIEKYM